LLAYYGPAADAAAAWRARNRAVLQQTALRQAAFCVVA